MHGIYCTQPSGRFMPSGFGAINPIHPSRPWYNYYILYYHISISSYSLSTNLGPLCHGLCVLPSCGGVRVRASVCICAFMCACVSHGMCSYVRVPNLCLCVHAMLRDKNHAYIHINFVVHSRSQCIVTACSRLQYACSVELTLIEDIGAM